MKQIYATFLFSVLSLTAFSQWNTDVAVNLDVANQRTDDIQTVTTTDGKTWVAFYSNTAGNYDMRAQLLDVDGTKLLGSNGVLVSNKTSGSATYVFNICLDAANNLIIAAQDQRSGSTNQAVAFKIDQTGAPLWGVDGVVLGAGLSPYPLSLPGGSAIIVWNDGTTNTLSMQRVSDAGVLVWATPVSVKIGTALTTRGQLISGNESSFTMVMQRRGTGVSSTLYAQRYDLNGTAIWNSGTPIQIGSQTTSSARYYSITKDADTTYFGYYSSQGSRFNSWLQRINPDGTIPYGMNGVSFDIATGSSDPYQQMTNIAIQPGSPYVWSLCTYSNSAQSQYGIYVQKFNKVDGSKVFGSNGKNVYPISTSFDTQTGGIALYNDAPIFMSYDVNYKIYATRLDANGNFVWPSNRIQISSTTATLAVPKGRFAFSYINGQGVGVWAENRGTENRAYAQNILPDGTTGPALPVTLTDLTALSSGSKIVVAWRTLSEINNKGFYVEKSSNGIDFQSIGFVSSTAVNGNSNDVLKYAFTDNYPFEKNNFYRLKQTDKDGRFVYSKIVQVRRGDIKDLTISNVYPNPVKQDLHISVAATANAKANMLITDMNGRIVVSKTYSLQQGINTIDIDAGNLAAGKYTISIIDNNNAQAIQSFIKR